MLCVPNPVVLANKQSLEKPEWGETTECRLCKNCGCMLSIESTQVTPARAAV